MSKWADYGSKAKESAGGGMFVRLTDGSSIKFIVQGDPCEAHKLFPEGGGKPTDVPPGTAGANVKIMLVAFDVDAKGNKVLQLTPNTFVDLAEKIAEFGDDHIFRVKRKGSGMTDTRYSVDHIGSATPEQLETAAGQDPIDLEEYGGRPMAISAAAAPSKPPLTPRRQASKPAVPDVDQPVDDVPF